MDAIIGTLQSIGIFIVGLVARIGLVLAIIALLLAPVAVGMGIVKVCRAGRRRMLGYSKAGDLLFREGLHFAPGHTWLKPEGARVKVGIDDLAQRLLPWVLQVQLPAAGTRVRAGEAVATIVCGGREARIAAPIDGTITALNLAVVQDPSLVKRENYGRGWLFAMAPADERWLVLPRGEPARRWLVAESGRLGRFLEQELGIVAADGGDWIAPPPMLLGPEQWKALTDAFLLPAA
jgi:glycine cleavage system H protein